MTQKTLFLLLIVIFVNSCSKECIEPGDGISSSNTKVEVPVLIIGANKNDKSTLWVDSGIDVKEKERITLSVNGTINLCADTEERMHNCSNPKLCSKTIVPASFCSDGSQPRFSGESVDPSVLCAHSSGTFSRKGWYVDSKITVNPGDQIKFNLVPSSEIKINDCYNIPSEVVTYSFSDLEKIYLKISNKHSLSSEDRNYIQDIVDNKLSTICEKGLDFVKIPNTNKYFKLEKFKGNSYNVYVNNSFTPYGNKVFWWSVGRHWYNGSLVDVRSAVHGDEYDYRCTIPPETDLLRFNTYNVNYRCNILCKDTDYRCFSSLRYKWKAGSNECKKNLNDSSGLKKCKALAFPVEKWADLLIAKVGANNIALGSLEDDPGDQCLPSNNTNSDCITFVGDTVKKSLFSLKLDSPYAILDNVKPISKVWLGISDIDNYHHDNIGGYHVEVKRSCIRTKGNGLYMYIGNTPNSVSPGDIGTDHLYIEANGADSNGIIKQQKFVVNGGVGKGNNPKSGRIYFGIKDAIDSDTVQDNFIEKPNNNKYVVQIYRVIWNPIFSDFFLLIRNTILSVLYGSTDGDIDINRTDGLIVKAYNNIINNGLIQFTQAVLVLFIAFSGISFMLGLMKRTQTELVIRVVKIGVILAAISPSSWELFGVTLFNLFVKGVDEIANIFSGVTGSDTGFAFLDPTVGALLTKEAWLRFLSIMFSGPIGFISFILLMWGIWTFLGAMIIAVMTYLMTLIGMSLMLILAPLFIITILFPITKTLFDSWIKMMLGMALAPIIMFSSLAFLHQVLMAAFFTINNFTACLGCIANIKFNIGAIPVEICPIKVLVPTTYISDYSFRDHMDQLYASSGENVFGLPFNLVAIVIFIITTFIMKAFIKISYAIAQSIAGTMTTDGISYAGWQAVQGLLSLVGQDNKTKELRHYALGGNNVEPTSVNVEKRSGIRGGGRKDIRGLDNDREEDNHSNSDEDTESVGDERIGPDVDNVDEELSNDDTRSREELSSESNSNLHTDEGEIDTSQDMIDGSPEDGADERMHLDVSSVDEELSDDDTRSRGELSSESNSNLHTDEGKIDTGQDMIDGSHEDGADERMHPDVSTVDEELSDDDTRSRGELSSESNSNLHLDEGEIDTSQDMIDGSSEDGADERMHPDVSTVDEELSDDDNHGSNVEDNNVINSDINDGDDKERVDVAPSVTDHNSDDEASFSDTGDDDNINEGYKKNEDDEL